MKKVIDKIKEEWNSYSKKIKITLIVLFVLAGLFVLFGIQILFFGLGYTDMDNLYPFGQWIIGDLGLVALGGGAFTTGFFLYIFRTDKLEPIINSCVLVGLLCYIFTLVYLIFDIGQPIRAGFGYMYPNWGPGLLPQSMLTEVVWCLTFYLMILVVEFIPIPLKHKVLDKHPVIHAIGHYMHKLMWIMAAAGTFLSFFHQGSLGGGMWGVLYGKVAWFRPAYFFTAIVAATAGGTSFMTLIVYIAGKVMKKDVVPKDTMLTLAKISGFMMVIYLLFNGFHYYSQAVNFVPTFDRQFFDIWGGYYGFWLVIVEFIFLITAAVLLVVPKFRNQEKLLLAGIVSGVLNVAIHKIIVIIHGSSVPNFPWREFNSYNPSLQEWAIMIGGLSVMVLIYMWVAKYLPLFPYLNKDHGDEAH